jgi:hypothetical protein
LAFSGFALGSCANAFRDFPDKSSDQYLVDQARKALDARDFDAAIDRIEELVAEQPKVEEYAYLASAAFAGRAGLRVLDLALDITTQISSKTLFQIFAEAYDGAGAEEQSDIDQAIALMQAYGASSDERTQKMNFFNVFVHYSRIGIILSRYAFDASTLRTNFSACNTTVDFGGSATGIPDADVYRVLVSMGHVVDSVSGLSASDLLDSLANLPGLGSIDPLNEASCPGNAKCLVMRTLINAPAPGFGLGVTAVPCL